MKEHLSSQDTCLLSGEITAGYLACWHKITSCLQVDRKQLCTAALHLGRGVLSPKHPPRPARCLARNALSFRVVFVSAPITRTQICWPLYHVFGTELVISKPCLKEIYISPPAWCKNLLCRSLHPLEPVKWKQEHGQYASFDLAASDPATALGTITQGFNYLGPSRS